LIIDTALGESFSAQGDLADRQPLAGEFTGVLRASVGAFALVRPPRALVPRLMALSSGTGCSAHTGWFCRAAGGAGIGLGDFTPAAVRRRSHAPTGPGLPLLQAVGLCHSGRPFVVTILLAQAKSGVLRPEKANKTA